MQWRSKVDQPRNWVVLAWQENTSWWTSTCTGAAIIRKDPNIEWTALHTLSTYSLLYVLFRSEILIHWYNYLYWHAAFISFQVPNPVFSKYLIVVLNLTKIETILIECYFSLFPSISFNFSSIVSSFLSLLILILFKFLLVAAWLRKFVHFNCWIFLYFILWTSISLLQNWYSYCLWGNSPIEGKLFIRIRKKELKSIGIGT